MPFSREWAERASEKVIFPRTGHSASCAASPRSELHAAKQMGLHPVLTLLLCPKFHGLCGHRHLLTHVKVRKRIAPKCAVPVQSGPLVCLTMISMTNAFFPWFSVDWGIWRHLHDVAAGLALVQPVSQKVTVTPGQCGTSCLGGSSTRAVLLLESESGV